MHGSVWRRTRATAQRRALSTARAPTASAFALQAGLAPAAAPRQVPWLRPMPHPGARPIALTAAHASLARMAHSIAYAIPASPDRIVPITRAHMTARSMADVGQMARASATPAAPARTAACASARASERHVQAMAIVILRSGRAPAERASAALTAPLDSARMTATARGAVWMARATATPAGVARRVRSLRAYRDATIGASASTARARAWTMPMAPRARGSPARTAAHPMAYAKRMARASASMAGRRRTARSRRAQRGARAVAPARLSSTASASPAGLVPRARHRHARTTAPVPVSATMAYAIVPSAILGQTARSGCAPTRAPATGNALPMALASVMTAGAVSTARRSVAQWIVGEVRVGGGPWHTTLHTEVGRTARARMASVCVRTAGVAPTVARWPAREARASSARAMAPATLRAACVSAMPGGTGRAAARPRARINDASTAGVAWMIGATVHMAIRARTAALASVPTTVLVRACARRRASVLA
mmetsp:Transcript_33201/g.87269  ORF Transcript_33201/g.87269 Transcript_33201/m.87269 type:complete len:485 (+) Transcript_33201:65-1519(+)